MVLGESFLHDRCPDGLFGCIRVHAVEDRLPVFSSSIRIMHRQEVVDDNRVRNSKRVEVDGVDTVGAQLVGGAGKELLDATWMLGKGGEG